MMKLIEDESFVNLLDGVERSGTWSWGDASPCFLYSSCSPQPPREYPAINDGPDTIVHKKQENGGRARARSSSARSTASSPAISPTRPPRSPLESTLLSPSPPSTCLLANDPRRWQHSGFAYFSTSPPSAPLRMVPVTPAAARADSFARSLRETKKSDQNHQKIRSLLYEVIAALPLQEVPAGRSARTSPPLRRLDDPSRSPEAAAQPHGGQHQATVVAAEAPPPYSDTCRSIAVQAHTTRSLKSQINPKKCDVVASDVSANERLGGKCSEEWIGGVRAMRDSHVRLVLRQVRHIARLNRALDRVVAVPRLDAQRLTSNV